MALEPIPILHWEIFLFPVKPYRVMYKNITAATFKYDIWIKLTNQRMATNRIQFDVLVSITVLLLLIIFYMMLLTLHPEKLNYIVKRRIQRK
ncbi:hypothetical protein XENTR_v10009310 [Xenopus tropicalis]|nr:hypothetical protein XENTR_v10009310 [Xenopus tropicalis]